MKKKTLLGVAAAAAVGAAVLALRGEKAAAWLSSEPLDRLGVYSVPWRGSARPGVLYTEYLGSGWYAGYACLGWG